MEVRDVMEAGAETCRLDDPLGGAARIMWERDCGCVPVVDEAGKLVAMLTDRDVCMAATFENQTAWNLPVSSAASRGVVAVHEHDSLEDAEALMKSRQLHRLPVVDGQGRPIGMLSITDLVRQARSGGEASAGLDPETLVRILAAICAERPKSARRRR